MPILVSVVVPTYKRPELLNRCLEALMAQDFDPSAYEVVVVDDALDEATRRIVEDWASRAESFMIVPDPALLFTEKTAEFPGDLSLFPRYSKSSFVRVPGIPLLRYISNTETHGPAAARNRGWRIASGEIIAFTDDDCLPQSGWLKHGVAAFKDGVVGVSGKVIVPLPDKPTDYELNMAELAHSQFVTANCFYRRSALLEVDGFDERFTIAWREDSDLFFRLIERRFCLAEAPDAVVVHPVRPARWGVSLAQQRRSQFNALAFKKHPQLYRQNLQSSPPWEYYSVLATLLMAVFAGLTNQLLVMLAALTIWSALTLRFFVRRIRYTSHSLSHITEMFITSILIPPLSVFWRLLGALKYRVVFL